MKCKIQWVDDSGRPTPDDNEASHRVRRLPYEGDINADGSRMQFTKSEWFPCCTAHFDEYIKQHLDREHWESEEL